MRYISTRGNMSSKAFTEVVLSGLASDGGLAIPESYPRISESELEQWRNLNYPDLAFKIISKFMKAKVIVDPLHTVKSLVLAHHNSNLGA